MSLPIADVTIRYALQTGLGLAALLLARPWRYYAALRVAQLPLAVAVGALVCGAWVLPESPWMSRFPFAQALYLKYGVRPFGVILGYDLETPFAPETCGWGLTLLRLAGSAFVIASAEEYFWRGFLLRWMGGREFLEVAPGAVSAWIFMGVAVLFGFEHDRWLVRTIAGLAYGWLYCRTGSLGAAVVAHGTTNLLLGLYVLAFAAHEFW